MTASTFDSEVQRGERFEFGKNWKQFLSVLTEEHITEAMLSLEKMLGLKTLAGESFLDAGCGSGLFSLAAMRLGADRVHSFDFDPESVACTRELKRRYFPDATNWTIEQASVLDESYLTKLGQWSIVYSWGVLHHTGNMWLALENVVQLVQEKGTLFISIYNDQGELSKVWRQVKRLYNKRPLGRWLVTSIAIPYFVSRGLVADLSRLKNPALRYREYKRRRGMSITHDWFDWLGGFPFEVATPDQVFEFYAARGFALARLKTCAGSLGCNEFVFQRQ
jgi:2-polyprenyl-3-methyl-5-hydroxy-6-metoxy-1,4-benzoquinol methylase